MTTTKVQSALDGWLDFNYYRNKGIREIEINFPTKHARTVFLETIDRYFKPRVRIEKKPNWILKITL